MFGYNDGGGLGAGGRLNNYYTSIQGLAVTSAIICTLLLTPFLGRWTEAFIAELVTDLYGPEWSSWGVVIWKVLLGGLVFYTTRAFLLAALVAVSIAVIQRFPLLAGV